MGAPAGLVPWPEGEAGQRGSGGVVAGKAIVKKHVEQGAMYADSVAEVDQPEVMKAAEADGDIGGGAADETGECGRDRKSVV